MTAGEPHVRRSPHLKADEAYLIKPEFTADGRTYMFVPEAVGCPYYEVAP